MIDRQLTQTNNNWREKVAELEVLLEKLRPQLIEAEARLADRLAAIGAFEFKLRARLEPLTRRLEKLQAEIQNYRQQLRRMYEDWVFANGDENGNRPINEEWDFDDGATAEGEYRYMGAPVESPPQKLTADENAQIKQLYRQLARRFHPDLAQDAAERAYRTGVMMAINAAYAAGDLKKLQELAQEPDAISHACAHTDQQLAQALFNELARCQRRLKEIRQELATLERHKSARLLRRAQRAGAQGRDLIGKIAAEIRGEIARKMVERDMLKQDIEAFGNGQPAFSHAGLADAIYDLGLEQAFVEDFTPPSEEWRRRRQDHYDLDDDILDDSE